MKQEKAATTQAPMVSVIVPVFNQRDYVERCLRSIASQKCDFPVEVIVGDDFSTDGTRDVLRSLESELPDWFHILLRPKNMGLRGENNCNDLLHRCRGRYMAILEGDDFWTNDGKLVPVTHSLKAKKGTGPDGPSSQYRNFGEQPEDKLKKQMPVPFDINNYNMTEVASYNFDDFNFVA